MSTPRPAAFVIGTGCTAFGREPARTFADFAREAVTAALADAGLGAAGDAARLDAAWFANCGLGAWGQGGLRGQVVFTPLVEDLRLLPRGLPVVNVEGGCASGSLALHGAWTAVRAGTAGFALAVGVEKMADAAGPARALAILDTAIDQLEPHRWRDAYARAGEALGRPFAPAAGESPYLHTYAMQAAAHMQRHGTTPRQIAAAAVLARTHAALNPLAQRRAPVPSVEEVLADRMIAPPLTRSMCSPMSDGAAAALLCSTEALATLPAAVRERAVALPAVALAGGRYASTHDAAAFTPTLTREAADRAYRFAGRAPEAIDIAEVHDATSFCALLQLEQLRLCAEGAAGAFVEAGRAGLEGERPLNLSGGLVGKGHPIGATGLSMVHEVVQQLRGEAGPRQARRARTGLVQNGGGVLGFGEAVCVVSILEALP
jgi:acetyl-CoA acetyltransferase